MENQGGILLAATADWLAGKLSADDDLAEQAEALARSLGYADSSDSERHGQIALLRCGARLKRVFQLRPPDAPGLFVFGGEADPKLLDCPGVDGEIASLAGCGLTLREALEPCLGEGVEYLSQLEWGDEGLVSGPADAVAHGLKPNDLTQVLARLTCESTVDGGTDLDWRSARRLADDTPILLPADLSLRRPDPRRRATPSAPLSLGAAAGRTVSEAVLSGLLELIERDALALWWQGGRRGRCLPQETHARGRIEQLLGHLRSGVTTRRSWIMDITSDVGVPVVIAMSINQAGRGFVFGVSAHTDLAEAARSAILEMCQMEMSYHLIDMKRRERGDSALNETDLRQLRRGETMDVDTIPILFPAGLAISADAPGDEKAEESVRTVAKLVQSAGSDVFYVDLTRRELSVPAAWVFAPGLQPMPGSAMTPRLKRCKAENSKGLFPYPIDLF